MSDKTIRQLGTITKSVPIEVVEKHGKYYLRVGSNTLALAEPSVTHNTHWYVEVINSETFGFYVPDEEEARDALTDLGYFYVATTKENL